MQPKHRNLDELATRVLLSPSSLLKPFDRRERGGHRVVGRQVSMLNDPKLASADGRAASDERARGRVHMKRAPSVLAHIRIGRLQRTWQVGGDDALTTLLRVQSSPRENFARKSDSASEIPAIFA
jgi:hypothetical protein